MDRMALEKIKLALETAIDNHDVNQPQFQMPAHARGPELGCNYNCLCHKCLAWSIWLSEKEIFTDAMACVDREIDG